MGSSASSSKSASKNVTPKIRVMGMFVKNKRPSKASDSKEFLRIMRARKMAALSAMETTESTIYRLRPPSPESPSKGGSPDIDDVLSLFNQDQDLVCSGCEKAMDPFKDTWYPCRACSRVFHKECVEKIKSVHKSVIETMDRANTNTGWSCHICDDLSLLLTEAELNSILEKFELIAQNRESRISLDDYVAYNKKISDEPLTQDDVKRLSLHFKLMDLDKNNYVEWWEFLNHEAKIKLSARSEGELVSLLSDKEVMMAKSVFRTLDENRDGTITEWEARRIYKSWYKRFDDKKDKFGLDRESTSLELHAESATRMIMESDTTKSGVVSWEDFLAGQALYIISARPNLTVQL